VLEETERLRLLGSQRLSSTMKQLIQQTPTAEGQVSLRVPLDSRAAVRAFSTLLATRSKLLSSRVKGKKL
jgi:hypothetical protein